MALAMPFNINNYDLNSDAIRDFSGNANHGQLGGGVSSNAPIPMAGIKGSGYSFDGNDTIVIRGVVHSPTIMIIKWDG